MTKDKKMKKSGVGWYPVDKECPVIYWEKTEWFDPHQKCEELHTNIFSQKKMAKRTSDRDKIIKVRFTIEEV